MRPLFEIDVVLDQAANVKGKCAEVTSISFHGKVESPLFQGTILPGAVDTQTRVCGKNKELSARYIIEGTDFRGAACRIYIENTACEDEKGVISKTRPQIITDSEALQWLEQAQLEGILVSQQDGIRITIYEKAETFQMQEYVISEGDKSIYGTLFIPEKAEKKTPMLIMSHGHNSCGEDMHDIAQQFAEKGIGCYCYDFSGGSARSKSSGKSTEMSIMTEQEDLRTVIRHIQELDWVDDTRIYLYGESQGGFVTGLTAPEYEQETAGVFLVFPAFCIPDDWREKRNTKQEEIPFWGLTLGRKFVEELPDYDVIKHAAKYGNRVMIFHGTNDEVVRIAYSEQLCAAYPHAELIVYPGQGHGFTGECRTAMVGKIVEEIRCR